MSLQYGDKGWLAVLGVVVAVEAKAPRGQLLSEAAARYKRRSPVITALVIGGLALHLYGLLPKSIDPLHRLAAAFGR
jgi:hypothetical protein